MHFAPTSLLAGALLGILLVPGFRFVLRFWAKPTQETNWREFEPEERVDVPLDVPHAVRGADPFGVDWVLTRLGPRNDEDTRLFEKVRAQINLLRRYVHDETPVVPETPAPPTDVLDLLCGMRLHWSGECDDGVMMRCDHCKAAKYRDVFPGKILYQRSVR